MKLYIVRHAEPNYEKNTITPAGHLEAQALAKRFKKTGLDEIYASPFGRAIDTVMYTEKALGINHQVEEWTRELWPELFVQHPTYGDIAWFDIPGEEYRGATKLPSHDDWYSHEVFGKHEVQDVVNKVRRDSDEFLNRLGFKREKGVYRRVKEKVPERVAVFCHLGLGLTWLSILLEIPTPLVWCGFFMPTSSVTTVVFEERSEGYAVPRCIGVGDVSHLYEAGLPISRFGINEKVKL